MEKHHQAGNYKTLQQVTVLLLLLMLSLLLTEMDAAGRRRCSSGSGGAGGGGGGRRRRNKRGNLKCSEASVAEYKLTFHGQWTEDRFPRMYPRRRPPAQWSKLVGRSHDPSYRMWELGQKADAALTGFAERGDSSLYENQPQGYGGIFDTFYAEPIASGEGWTSTYIMADGLHSRMSFMVKLVPSPDWFVGIDSLELCRRGRWRARAHINLRPVDGGTQRGYTFTSPTWPSLPQEPVYQITSTYPDHPASSFLYPQYRRLPRIAFVDVERVAQYFRKGPASPLKSNRTANLKVYKKTTTTTMAIPTTTTPNTTSAVSNDMDPAQVLGKTAEPSQLEDMAPNMNEVNQHMDSNLEFAAAHTLHYTHLDQRRFPLTTIIGAPTSASSSDSTMIPAVPSKTFQNFPVGISAQSEEEQRLDHSEIKHTQGLSAAANLHSGNFLGESSYARDMKRAMHHSNSEAGIKQTAPDSSLVATTTMETTPKGLLATMYTMSSKPHESNSQLEEFEERDPDWRRSDNMAMYHSGAKPDPSHSQAIPSLVEPVPSQSEHTFDEPQFPELSADDSYANSAGRVDCTVGEWSHWSPCSKTCGFGVQTRSRDVLSYSRNAGMACPLLEQEVLCGSMRTCKWDHFSFLNDKNGPRRVRRRRVRHHNHHRKRSLGTKPRLRSK